jgi:hypothetical protein
MVCPELDIGMIDRTASSSDPWCSKRLNRLPILVIYHFFFVIDRGIAIVIMAQSIHFNIAVFWIIASGFRDRSDMMGTTVSIRPSKREIKMP